MRQLRFGQRFWNTLVAIERVRTARYRRIMSDEDQERADILGGEIAGIRDAIKGARKQARSRAADLGDMPERLATLKAERGAIIARLKDTRAARHAERKAQLDANVEAAYRRIKRARQAAASMGLFWGSYNDIVQRADAGRKLGDLQFRRFTGDGTITAQVMGGASVAQCVGGAHTFFQIDVPTEGQKWRYARIRIGSNADRSPVWLDLPIVYHREIPEDAQIKSASATRRTVAGKVRWQVNVTASVPRAARKAGPRVIAIDIGWRLMPDGVRVAYWSDGRDEGHILVPMQDIEQYRKVESLRSTCDLTREECIPILASWLGGQDLNEEWGRRSSHLIQWRSSDRLANLIRWWADNRIEGDADVFEYATSWRKQYLHLADWWRNLSEQMTLRLREQYRIFAARVARDYDTLLIESFDLREVTQKPSAESKEVRTASASYRQIVSPSTFRAALRNACLREGVLIEEVPAEYSTRTCHRCGDCREWDQVKSVMHKCDACGAGWDQDANAVRNLLARWRASGEVARIEAV